MPKKLLAVLLSLAFAVSCLAACGRSQESSSSAASGQDDGLVTITYLLPDSGTPEYPRTLDRPNVAKMVEMIKEKFGVNIDFETYVSDPNTAALMAARFASDTLPDMVNYAFPQAQLIELYEQNQILAISDYWDENGPDIKRRMTVENPYLQAAHGDAEGNVLRVCSLLGNIQHRINVASIRHDWLQELNMEVPTTANEYYDAIKAFQDNDMNGSGLRDEVYTGWRAAFNRSISSGFGVKWMQTAGDSFFYDNNNKVYHTMLTPEAKDYFAFMGNMAAEGFLDKEFINQTGDMYNEKLYANRVAGEAGAWWDSVVYSNMMSNTYPDSHFIPLEPFIAPDGSQSIVKIQMTGYNGYMITRSCKNPDKAVQVLNWGYTLEGMQQDYYGEFGEGGDYYEKASYPGLDLAPQMMSYTEKGRQAADEEPALWAKMGWNGHFIPQYALGKADDIAMEFFLAFTPAICGRAAEIDFNMTKLNKIDFDIGIEGIGFAAPSPDQSSKIETYSDLILFMNEETDAFLTNEKDVTKNWDTFVEQCKRMGIDDYVEIQQARYDKYLNMLSN